MILLLYLDYARSTVSRLIFPPFLTTTDSIFHDPGTGVLFASFKYIGNDYVGDMARMRENPKVREWWAMTDGFQEVNIPKSHCCEEDPWDANQSLVVELRTRCSQ